MFFNRFRSSRRHEIVRNVYDAIVAQARQPDHYLDAGVPDTVEGRFEMIVLHVILMIRRLRGNGDRADSLAQEIVDEMFRDMDRNLREIGVGDLSVGKKVRRLAEAYQGRAKAYDRALAEADPEERAQALATVLGRTIFSNEPPSAAPARLARSVLEAEACLARWDIERIMRGTVRFDANEGHADTEPA